MYPLIYLPSPTHPPQCLFDRTSFFVIPLQHPPWTHTSPSNTSSSNTHSLSHSTIQARVQKRVMFSGALPISRDTPSYAAIMSILNGGEAGRSSCSCLLIVSFLHITITPFYHSCTTLLTHHYNPSKIPLPHIKTGQLEYAKSRHRRKSDDGEEDAKDDDDDWLVSSRAGDTYTLD